MAIKKIEDGISAYLVSLGQSDKPVIDREAVKDLKAQIRAEPSPIAKLRLLAALEEEEAGRAPDHSGDRAVFVAEAKGWADSEGIPVTAFQALGVPDDILREAGFTVTPAGGNRRSSGTRTRAPRIPLQDVAAVAKELRSGWKLSDLAEKLDRDPTTVRNYVNKLVDAGTIAVVGDDPHHDGRGRAPKLYGAG